jgi:hypothetical protein
MTCDCTLMLGITSREVVWSSFYTLLVVTDRKSEDKIPN